MLPLILAISPFTEDHESLRNVASSADWRTAHCRTYQEASRLLQAASVVICDEQLADGDWRTVLNGVQTLRDPPALIVASRLADAPLWAEVLNLGAWDLLERPFRVQDVMHTVGAALQWREVVRKRSIQTWN